MAEAYRQEWSGTSIGFSTLGMSGSTVKDNILQVRTTSTDPQVDMRNLGSFNPTIYKYIQVRWRVDSGVSIGPFQIYFYNTGNTSATEAQVVTSPGLVGNGQWVNTVIDMSAHSRWAGFGNITGWRFDPGSVASVVIEIDYIVLRDNTAPYAPYIHSPVTGSTVNTATPTVYWYFGDANTGASQSAYNVEIVPEAYNTVLWGSGWVSSASNSLTLPAGYLVGGLKYYIRVQVKDEYGLVNAPSTEGVGDANYYHTFITIEGTAPTITSIQGLQHYSSGATMTKYAYGVTDNVGVSYVLVHMVRPDNTFFQIANATRFGSTNDWYATYTFPAGEAEGTWGVDFRAYDAVGNVVGPVRGYVVYDKTAPSLTRPIDQSIVSPTGNTGTVTLTATASDAVSGINRITLSIRKSIDGGTSYGSFAEFNMTSAGSNIYNLTFDRAVYGFGKYHLQTRAYDNAGNVTGPTDSYYNLQSGLGTSVTSTISSILANTATAAGSVTAFDGGIVSQYGHVWGTATAPTTALTTKTALGAMASPVAYNSSITGLTPVTLYYIRAYVTTQYGTSYGAQTTFTTLDGLAVLSTTIMSIPTSNSSDTLAASNITSLNGAASIIQYGHVWSTSALATINLASKSTLGARSNVGGYQTTIPSGVLAPTTLYYIRSYATTAQGTTYGADHTFTTNKSDQAAPAIPVASNITGTSMTITSTPFSNISCNGVIQSSGTTWTGLSPNTSYTVAAWFVASGSLFQSPYASAILTTAYGVPVVTTSTPTTVGNTINISGNITSTGGGGITQHGHVWSTATGPTIALGTKTTLGIKTSIGTFKSNISGLASDTLYYVRAYTTNSAGTGYGAEYTITVTGVVSRLKKDKLSLIGQINERAPKVSAPIVYYPFDGTADAYTSTTATLTENNLQDYGEFFLPVDAPTFSTKGCYFNGNNTCYLRTGVANLPPAVLFDGNEFLDLEIEFNPDALANYALTSFYSGYNYASKYTFTIRTLASGAVFAMVGSAAKVPQEYHNNGWSLSATSSAVVKVGAWNKVRITYDKEYLRLYVNGKLEASSAALPDVSLETTPGNGIWQNYRQRDLRSNWTTGLFIGADGAYTLTLGQVTSPTNDYYARVPAWDGYNSFKGYLRNFKISQGAPAILGTGASVSSKGLLVEESTINVVSNTDLNTGWGKEYGTSIQWNGIAPPDGITSPVLGFIDADTNGESYWYSYGNYAAQDDVSDYTISVYVKTEGPVSIRAYTGDNVELHRKYTEYVAVIPQDGWKKVTWAFIKTELNNDTDSLSFQFFLQSGKRMWLCAPQMEDKQFSTSFVAGQRRTSSPVITKVAYKPALPITVSLDYEVDSRTVTGSEQALFSFDTGSMDLNTFSLHQLGDGTFRLRAGSGIAAYQEIFAPVQTNGVHHFVSTLTTTRMELWIDGVQASFVIAAPMAVPDASSFEYMRVGNSVNNNLVKNGSANLGTNINFTSFTYMTGDSYDGDDKCFYKTSGAATLFSDEFIPVDTNRTYTLEGAFKNAGTDPGRLYYGVCCFDKNKSTIPVNRIKHAGLTTLAQALKPGDTVVYLANATGWAAGTAGVYHYSKQFAWWISGEYQKYTYSDGAVGYITLDTTAKTILLQSAWTGATLPVGTPVANSTDGSGYNYMAAQNVIVPTTWTVYSGSIGGVSGSSENMFRYGTKYVRILFLANREAATTPTLRVDAMKFYDSGLDYSPANRPISNLGIYNRVLTSSEISSLNKPKNSIKANGDLSTSKMVEGTITLNSTDFLYPLSVDGKDSNHFNGPVTETNTVYEDGSVWIGSAISNVAGFDTTFESLAIGDVAGFTNQLIDGTCTVSSDMAKTGARSLKIQTTDPEGGQRVYRTFAVNIGEWVTISAWVYATIPFASIHIQYIGNSYSGKDFNSSTHKGTGWEKITVSATEAAVSATTGYMHFYAPEGVTDSYWDEIQIVKSPYASPYTPSSRGAGSLKYSFPTIITANNDWTVGIMAKPNAFNMTGATVARFVPLAVGNYYTLNQSDACIGYSWGAGSASTWQLIGYNNTASTYVGKYGPIVTSGVINLDEWNLYILKYDSVNNTMVAEIYGADNSSYASSVTTQTMVGVDPVVRVGGYSWDESCWDGYLKNLFVTPRFMSSAELLKMWKTKMKLDKSGQTKVLGNIIEGQVL